MKINKERSGNAKDAGEPEHQNDLRLFPTQLFKMVMDRGHTEHAFPRQLEACDLDHHGERLNDINTAHQHEEEFRPGEDGKNGNGTAEEERTRVPHKHFGGIVIEKEECQADTGHGGGKYRQHLIVHAREGRRGDAMIGNKSVAEEYKEAYAGGEPVRKLSEEYYLSPQAVYKIIAEGKGDA